MIVVCAGEKGGSGKTTIATNLAVMRASKGHEILLVDTDYQKTASYWSSTRDDNSGLIPIPTVQKTDNIKKDVLILKEKFENIIIDAGGFDSSALRTGLLVSNIALFPVRASQFDLWTLPKIDSLVDQAKTFNPDLKAYVHINQGSPHPFEKEYDEVLEFMQDLKHVSLLKTIVMHRKAYRKAAIFGQSVIELNPPDRKAAFEMLELYMELYKNE